MALTTSAISGSTFIGWTGAVCGDTGICNVTLSAAQTVNAQCDVAAIPLAVVPVPALHPALLALLAFLTALIPLSMTRSKR